MACLLQTHPQLGNSGILLGRGVARMSALGGGSSRRIVVVVVLGVELELVGGCSSHDVW